MRDSVASFYGGYDLELRTSPVQRHIGLPVILLIVALLVLVGFVGADVAAYQGIPPSVQVTAVDWYADSQLLASTGGFSLHGSESVTLSLMCSTVCYAIGGATVSAPFHLTGFLVSYSPDQYTNVTVTAPANSYHGPLSITLTPPGGGDV
jgi:hypothetical protein